MVNLEAQIEAYDADGTLIKNKDGNFPTLREVCLFALRHPASGDEKTGAKEKDARGLLIRRIASGVPEIELTEAEKAQTKDRIGRLYLQPEVVTGAFDILDGRTKEVPPAEPKT